MKLFLVKINNKRMEMQENLSILQACELINILIPRFCYYPFVSIAGNCRICLVFVKKMPKLQASCSVIIVSNMNIFTNTNICKKSREGILEFLLINHPLDCPICDQAGLCDLQDQVMFFGSDKSRFFEHKKAFKNKNLSPIVKIVMSRCINCTRCVRFANEILGLFSLGTSNKGHKLEITFFSNKLIFSKLSGNLIDICPVGAFNSKKNAFLARPWELKSIESFDFFDAVNCNLRIDYKNYQIVKIVPRLNQMVNDFFISDKIRFSIDGFNLQRIVKPFLKNKEFFLKYPWYLFINLIMDKLFSIKKSFKIGFTIGSFSDLETLIFIKFLTSKLNAFVFDDFFENTLCLDFQNSFQFSINLKNICFIDFCLFVFVNPRHEAIFLSYHLRKKYLSNPFLLGFFGNCINFTFPNVNLGISLLNLILFFEGKYFFCKNFRISKKPLVVFGKSFSNSIEKNQLNFFFSFFKKIFKRFDFNWKYIHFLTTNASDFSKHFLGIKNSKITFYKKLDVTYVLENTFKKLNAFCSLIQTTNGILKIKMFDFVLPTLNFLEKRKTFINFEGFVNISSKGVLNNIFSKTDCFFLSGFFYNFFFKKDILKLKDFLPCLNVKNFKRVSNLLIKQLNYQSFIYLNSCFISSTLLNDFYITNLITKNSYNMLECSKKIIFKNPFAFVY